MFVESSRCVVLAGCGESGSRLRFQRFTTTFPPCAMSFNQQKKEALIPHETSKTPWTEVAVDLFTSDANNYVVAVD